VADNARGDKGLCTLANMVQRYRTLCLQQSENLLRIANRINYLYQLCHCPMRIKTPPATSRSVSSIGFPACRRYTQDACAILLKIQLLGDPVALDSLSQRGASYSQKFRRFNLVTFRSLHREQGELPFQPGKQLERPIG